MLTNLPLFVRPLLLATLLATLGASTVACLNPQGANGSGGGQSSAEPSADPAASPGPSYPAPLDDVVPRVGRDDTLDMATWNIRNFPTDDQTPRLVADLITSMDLDLIAVEEITDQDAFDELVARLPNHSGALSGDTYSDGTYQKVGFIYRSDLVTLSNVSQIYSGSGLAFPRPPLFATVTVNDTGLDFTAIAVHLKAGSGPDEHDRRAEAIRLLDTFVQGQVDGVGDDDVVILGDFNENITTGSGRDVFAPLLDESKYTIQTAPLAQSGLESFLGGGRFIDHIVTTVQMDANVDGYFAQRPALDHQFDNYKARISDHLPAVLPIPFP